MSSGKAVSVIGQDTKVTGLVETEDVLIVAGTVEGEIRSSKVIIKDRGRVNGGITCDSLVIEDGGVFDGQAAMAHGSELDERSAAS